MPILKKHLHLFLLVLLVAALGAAAYFYSTASDAVPGLPSESIETTPPEEAPPVETPSDASACAEAGGVWNPCASACPDAGPDEVCIQVCVERCEGLGHEAMLPVFFHNSLLSSRTDVQCDEVYPARRTLSRTGESVAWPEVAVRSLLAGPSETESVAGFSTSIPEGVALRSFRIEERIAYADFSSEMNTAAGSCRVIAIRAQIESTLMAFAEIDEAVISVEGSVDEALQP